MKEPFVEGGICCHVIFILDSNKNPGGFYGGSIDVGQGRISYWRMKLEKKKYKEKKKKTIL